MRAVQILVEWSASFIEVALYLMLMHTVSEGKFRGKKQAVSFAFVLVVIASGIILLNMAEVSISLPTLLYAVVSYALGASILYRGRFSEYLFASTGFIAVILMVDTVTVAALGWAGMKDVVAGVLSGQGIYRILVIMAVKMLDTGIVLLVCRGLKRVAYRLRMSGGYAAMITCLLMGGIGGIYLVTQAESLVGIVLNPFQLLIGFSLILVVCTLYFFLRIRETRREQEYTARQNRILEQNYQAAKESYETNAMLYHDMRNHFAMVQGYLTDGKVAEAQAYLEEINGWIDAYPKERWTGIGALDYILNQKKETAARQGTGMVIHAEYPADCRIDPVDLCAILTNLLDNAMEACARQPEGESREIIVTIRRINLFLIIRITNSSATAPAIKDGSLVTSKRDRRLHGWGLRSVKAAVEKYQGSMEITYSNLVYTVDVMLFYQ